ncbi:MalY/PatB family protein [Vagococcus jeotgali]|uniref:MalY/PatB family protein n=1 Tax=Vagococcus jeotgali TaxID=3109030 RepID=UPI002DDBA104|nr:MalY/PatB family protein [Vagococcus sp. B2T-5]
MSPKKINFDKQVDRLGTYCTQWDYVKDRFGESDLLPFTISDTDFEVPVEVMEALKERMNHGVFGYTRWNHTDLKSSITSWYNTRFQTYINAEDIVYTPSVMYGISQLIELLTNKNDGVIIQTPAYDAFFKIIQASGRKLIENSLIYQNEAYTIDFKDLENKLAAAHNKVLLLCSPHNPTGRVWSKEELERIVLLCQKHEVFIISDEIHMDITRYDNQHIPITNFDYQHVAIATSGTKTFNFPGLIFSFMLIPNQELREDYLTILKEKHGLSSVSIMGMEATMAAYNNGSDWVDQLNDYIDDNYEFACDFLQKKLPDIKVVHSQATYLMWLDVSELGIDMSIIQDKLIKEGKVAIMNGAIYGGNGKEFLRLNIGCSREKLIDGLNRMYRALKNLE